MKHVIPEGTSEPQDFELRDNGEAFVGAEDLEVALVIERYVDGAMAAVETPPSVDWLEVSAGTVRVTGCESLVPGNYYVRFRVTNADEEVGFFPNGEKADHWQVVEVTNR